MDRRGGDEEVISIGLVGPGTFPDVDINRSRTAGSIGENINGPSDWDVNYLYTLYTTIPLPRTFDTSRHNKPWPSLCISDSSLSFSLETASLNNPVATSVRQDKPFSRG